MEARKRMMLCPSQSMGHIAPMLVLARRLANLDVPVTILCISKSCYEMVLPEVDGQNGIEIEALEAGEDDTASTHITTVMEGVRSNSYGRNQLIKGHVPSPALQIALESKLKHMISHGLAPAGVITDMLLDWASRTVRSVGLPLYVLYTCGAILLAHSFHLMEIHNAGIKPKPYEFIPHVSGLPSVVWDELPSFFHDQNSPLYHWKHLFDMELVHAHGILINTFDEMESEVLEAIRSRIPAAKVLADKIYPIGPLIEAEYFVDDASKRCNEESCLQWLDKQEDSSVLYISFGSWTAINKEQVIELAFGLLAAAKPYLWVLPEEFKKFLPPELEEVGNGHITHHWAPQKLILSHRSIGGFLTHCGWNSIIEAISLGGIPMIAWPFTVDQPINARYLVDELKVAVDVHEQENGLVVREEVQRVVLELLVGLQSKDFKLRAKKLHVAAADAVSSNGPSALNLKKFVLKITS